MPYAQSLAMEKKKVAVTMAKKKEAQGTDSKTAAQTTKGGVRVAHVPQVVSSRRSNFLLVAIELGGGNVSR